MEPGENSVLTGRGTKDIRVCQQWNGILGILAQTFEGKEDESFILVDRRADGAAELISPERVLDRQTLRIGGGGIEDSSGRERLSEREGVARIHTAIAEIAVRGAVHIISA